MDYYIEYIDSENLKKLYLVLNDIYNKFILTQDFEDLNFGSPKGLKGVSSEEHRLIIDKLISEDCLEYRSNRKGKLIFGYRPNFSELQILVGRKINELNKIENKLIFDQENSILFFKGQKIMIAKQKKKTIAHEVLKYVFDHGIENVAYYAEIADYLAGQDDYHKKHKIGVKYYNACKDIQEKIRKQTEEKIEDFLVFNVSEKGEVYINKAYL